MNVSTRITAALLLAAAIALPASAIDRAVREHDGFVDGRSFVELADEDGQLIEVTLGPRLLGLFTKRANRRKQSSIAEILRPLIGLNALVADVKDSRHEVERKMARISRDLEKDERWERFVRVRERDEQDYQAYIHVTDDDKVDGLLVLGFTEGDQMIFVNLVGTVDMERIFILGERLGLPALEDLPPRSEVERSRRRDSDV